MLFRSLDVRSESEADDEARRARASLSEIAGVGDVVAELLYQNGFKSAEEVAQADEQGIGDVEGVGPDRAGNILKAARELVEEKRIKAEADAAAALVAAEQAKVEQAAADAAAAALEAEQAKVQEATPDATAEEAAPDATAQEAEPDAAVKEGEAS